MLSGKLRIPYLDVPDLLAETVVERYRHGQPLQADGRFDAVPLLPGLLLKLHAIQKDECIYLIHQVEIP
jgi:hypothetical protein